MPELPEVYTIVQYLQKKIRGEIFKKTWADTPKIFGGTENLTKITRKIKGQKILSVQRVGKNILFNLSEGDTLLAHQKMSGHFLVGYWRKIKQGKTTSWVPIDKIKGCPIHALTDSANRFLRVVFEFESGRMLALSDMRKFATIALLPTDGLLEKSRLKILGPDWWDKPLSPQALLLKLKASKKSLKSFLLDQNIAAGLGNIYADESLFRAGLSPLRKTMTLNLKDAQKLTAAIHETLALAIKSKGTSFSDFRQANGEKGKYQNSLQVYGRKGQPCLRCGVKLIRIKIGQRSTVYCPHCQK